MAGCLWHVESLANHASRKNCFSLLTLLTPNECVFVFVFLKPINFPTLWTPTECLTVQFTSDIVSLELAQIASHVLLPRPHLRFIYLLEWLTVPLHLPVYYKGYCKGYRRAVRWIEVHGVRAGRVLSAVLLSLWSGGVLPSWLVDVFTAQKLPKPLTLGFSWRLPHVGTINHWFHLQPLPTSWRMGWDWKLSFWSWLHLSSEQPPPSEAHPELSH